ncbi:hypothetical protein Purlil1_12164 [Purpureocillium lilacinum]|uniref:RING-type domain-containing protein n=1 Tax=Purpureocillium lilacinum TaxID=33203 RepID=A0ABR0BHJ4_PURLI|nr:hypothetical protein Purlil1_12164 [Purpureocillium lilacinum]
MPLVDLDLGKSSEAVVNAPTMSPVLHTSTAHALTGSETSAALENGQSDGEGRFTDQLVPVLIFASVVAILGIIFSARHFFANVRNGTRSNSENVRPAVVEQLQRHYVRHGRTVMTANDVNERFPMIKYKFWIPVYAGGRSSTTASGAIPQPGHKDRTMPRPVKTAHQVKESPHSGDVGALAPEVTIIEDGNYEADLNVGVQRPVLECQWSSTGEGFQQVAAVRDEEGQNEPILPTRTPSDPGGPCSICLDPLENEDGVRALECGHVFHVACVDAWLISRRACCLVCKAEYHSCTHRRSASNSDAAGSTNLGLQNDPSNLPRRLRAAFLRREGGSSQPSRQADP